MPFNNDSDPELIAKSAALTQAFTPEVRDYLLSFLPTVESVQEGHDRLTAGYTAFLAGGSPEEWESQRNAVAQALAVIHGFAKAVTVKDPKAPERIGVVGPQHTRTGTALGPLPAPQDFKVQFNKDGKLFASCQNIRSARGFQLWGCDGGDPNDEANWRMVTPSPSCRGIEVLGVNRSNAVWLKIRAVRKKGEMGPWSNLIRLPPV